MNCQDENRHVDDNDKNENDNNSIHSQDEALMELLGLGSFAVAMDDVTTDDDDSTTTTEYSPETRRDPESSRPWVVDPQRITVPPNNHRHFHAPQDCWAYQFPKLISVAECQQLIDLASSTSSSDESSSTSAFQYVTQALHITPDGQQLAVQLQNPNRHKLSVFSHDPSADLIWERLKKVLLVDENGNPNVNPLLAPLLAREGVDPPIGLNPRLRILRYDAEDKDDFTLHFDATTRIDNVGISLLTVLLYLNTGGGLDFDGGETCFWNAADLSQQTVTKIIPQVGTVVIFEHDLYHSGQLLHWGTKYVLRTDLLFQMSHEKWEQRAANATSCGDPSSTVMSIPSSSIVATVLSPPPPTTMLELIESMEDWNEAERFSILEALQAIGMTDASIETFCTPGHSAMHDMLQDILPSSLPSAFRYKAGLLVELAFAQKKDGRMQGR
jgi:hypothetical protein